jgi:multidrug efflux pump subunit AcrB
LVFYFYLVYLNFRYRVVYPAAIGTTAAILTSIYLAMIFLPSIVSTTLQLRSGTIPTLHDKDFNKYRRATDQVSILTGSMFWGSLISSMLVGGAVGLLVFLCLWQVRTTI